MQFEIHVRKADHSETLDFSQLPENVQQFVAEYGLRQILNDSVSGVKDQEEAQEKVQAKAQALREGTIKMSGGGGRAKSEVDREAEEMLAGLLKQAGVANLTEARKLAKDQGNAVRQLVAKRTGKRADRVGKQKAEQVLGQIRAKAEENVKARQVDVDLDLESESDA
jgi:hypothetical protein